MDKDGLRSAALSLFHRFFIEIENARSLDSRRLRPTLRKRIAYISAKAGVIKRILP